ncbi:MAG: ABC transporter substrate-binding protein [Desulfamplus sp.]|nr:ABC transporter substrate-binding protein [Desulfamplus sp.]
MKKSFLLICIALFSSLFQAAQPYAAEKVILQLRWDNQFQFAGYYAAMWMGYYQKEGIEVQIRSAVRPDMKILSSIKEVVDGRADFGIGAADILLAIDKGADLSVLAPVFQQSAARFYYKKDTLISSLTDLTKLRVARSVNDLIDIEFQALLRAEGIDPELVPSVEHVPEIDPFVKGIVDVIPGYSITIPYEIKKYGIEINNIRPSNYGVDFYGDTLFAKRELTEERTEMVENFIRASIKGWDYAFHNSDEIVQRICRDLGRSVPVDDLHSFNRFQAEGVKKLTLHPIVELGSINPDRWARMHKFLKNAGILKNELDLQRIIFDPFKIEKKRQDRFKKIFAVFSILFLVAALLSFVWILTLKKKIEEGTKKLRYSNNILETEIEERKRAKAEVDEANMKYQLAMEATSDVLWDWNIDSGEVYFSPAWRSMLDEPEELPQYHSWEERIHPDQKKSVLDSLLDHVKGKTGQWVKEHQIRTASKEWKWVLARGRVVKRDADGRALRMIGTIADISLLKKMEADLLRAQKMESIGTLAGGIAHDFNNILASILGFAEIGMDEAEKGSSIEESFKEIYTAGKRAKELIRQILSFARQSAEEFNLLQVNHIAKEVLKLIRSSIPTTIAIRHNIESKSAIMANPVHIHQIFMNLCTNAAHAMEQTGGILSVELKDITVDDDNMETIGIFINHGKYIRIIVSDTGSGIAHDIKEKIFNPYFTTKEDGKGTGLGLSMVHSIVENIGGKIVVESEAGQGSTFLIYLPVAQNHAESSKDEPEILPKGSEHIFLVDDEAPIRNMCGRILERLGYNVSTSTGSVEALAIFKDKASEFDLVISDMTMPDMTGDKLAIEMMKIRPDIPVIICTGYTNIISEERAASIGVKAFAYKPVVKAELAKMVRDILDDSKKVV